jgi:hypothetical protein
MIDLRAMRTWLLALICFVLSASLVTRVQSQVTNCGAAPISYLADMVTARNWGAFDIITQYSSLQYGGIYRNMGCVLYNVNGYAVKIDIYGVEPQGLSLITYANSPYLLLTSGQLVQYAGFGGSSNVISLGYVGYDNVFEITRFVSLGGVTYNQGAGAVQNRGLSCASLATTTTPCRDGVASVYIEQMAIDGVTISPIFLNFTRGVFLYDIAIATGTQFRLVVQYDRSMWWTTLATSSMQTAMFNGFPTGWMSPGTAGYPNSLNLQPTTDGTVIIKITSTPLPAVLPCNTGLRYRRNIDTKQCIPITCAAPYARNPLDDLCTLCVPGGILSNKCLPCSGPTCILDVTAVVIQGRRSDMSESSITYKHAPGVYGPIFIGVAGFTAVRFLVQAQSTGVMIDGVQLVNYVYSAWIRLIGIGPTTSTIVSLVDNQYAFVFLNAACVYPWKRTPNHLGLTRLTQAMVDASMPGSAKFLPFAGYIAGNSYAISSRFPLKTDGLLAGIWFFKPDDDVLQTRLVSVFELASGTLYATITTVSEPPGPAWVYVDLAGVTFRGVPSFGQQGLITQASWVLVIKIQSMSLPPSWLNSISTTPYGLPAPSLSTYVGPFVNDATNAVPTVATTMNFLIDIDFIPQCLTVKGLQIPAVPTYGLLCTPLPAINLMALFPPVYSSGLTGTGAMSCPTGSRIGTGVNATNCISNSCVGGWIDPASMACTVAPGKLIGPGCAVVAPNGAVSMITIESLMPDNTTFPVRTGWVPGNYGPYYTNATSGSIAVRFTVTAQASVSVAGQQLAAAAAPGTTSAWIPFTLDGPNIYNVASACDGLYYFDLRQMVHIYPDRAMLQYAVQKALAPNDMTIRYDPFEASDVFVNAFAGTPVQTSAPLINVLNPASTVSMELALHFNVTQTGGISALWFFKFFDDTASSHQVKLWQVGVLNPLAVSTTANEITGSNWIRAALSVAVVVYPGIEYMVSYSHQNGVYPAMLAASLALLPVSTKWIQIAPSAGSVGVPGTYPGSPWLPDIVARSATNALGYTTPVPFFIDVDFEPYLCIASVNASYGLTCTKCPALQPNSYCDVKFGPMCNTGYYQLSCAKDPVIVCMPILQVIAAPLSATNSPLYHTTCESRGAYYNQFRNLPLVTSADGTTSDPSRMLCLPNNPNATRDIVVTLQCGQAPFIFETVDVTAPTDGTATGYIINYPFISTYNLAMPTAVYFYGQVFANLTFVAGRVTSVAFMGTIETNGTSFITGIAPASSGLSLSQRIQVYQDFVSPGAPNVTKTLYNSTSKTSYTVSIAPTALNCALNDPNSFVSIIDSIGTVGCACNAFMAYNPKTMLCQVGCANSSMTGKYCNIPVTVVNNGAVFCDTNGYNCACTFPFLSNSSDSGSCRSCAVGYHGVLCLPDAVNVDLFATTSTGLYGTGNTTCNAPLNNATGHCDCPSWLTGTGPMCANKCPSCPVETSICAGGVMVMNGTCNCRPNFYRTIRASPCACQPGMFGPDCMQTCPTCGANQVCDDNWNGSGQCKCAPGLANANGTAGGFTSSWNECTCTDPTAWGPLCSGICTTMYRSPPAQICLSGFNNTFTNCTNDYSGCMPSNHEMCVLGVNGTGCTAAAGFKRPFGSAFATAIPPKVIPKNDTYIVVPAASAVNTTAPVHAMQGIMRTVLYNLEVAKLKLTPNTGFTLSSSSNSNIITTITVTSLFSAIGMIGAAVGGLYYLKIYHPTQ